MKKISRLISWTLIALVACSPFIASAQDISASTTPQLYNITIPFSLIEYWSSHDGLPYPANLKKFGPLASKSVQYFLMAQGFPVKPSGVMDKKTIDALRAYQGGEDTKLLPETKDSINALLSYVYCPAGQVPTFSEDFRLENVNKPNVLPKNYVPQDLMLDMSGAIPSYGYICLESETYRHFLSMYEAALRDDVQLFLTSTYRGEDSQKYLLDVMVRDMGKYAYRIVATPGQSEHNLGTSFDVAGFDNGKSTPIAAGNQFKWLKENASKYGFVNSYPQGKEAITGFLPEPWHWRYVGVPVASEVKRQGITLKEFLENYRDRLVQGAAAAQVKFNGLLNDIVIIGG